MASNRFRSQYILIALLILSAIIAGYYAFKNLPSEKDDSNVIARIGPRKITVESFQNEIARRSGNIAGKTELLDEMIEYETLLLKGIEAGLDKDPEVIRSYHNIIVGKLKQRDLMPLIENVQITDEEIESWYNANIKTYTEPAKVRLAMLYLKTDSFMSAERVAELHERLSEARDKADGIPAESGFGALAVDYSEDQRSRYRGGDIGWIDKGRAYRSDEKVISEGFRLEEIGDVSDIITAADGIYLLKLMDKAEPSVQPLETVKTAIYQKLLIEKRRAVEQDFYQELKDRVLVEIYPEILDSIPIETEKKDLPQLK